MLEHHKCRMKKQSCVILPEAAGLFSTKDCQIQFYGQSFFSIYPANGKNLFTIPHITVHYAL